MTNIINEKNLHNSLVISDPYPFILSMNLINPEIRKKLLATYPSSGFVPNKRVEGSRKHYQFDVMNIIKVNQHLHEYTQLDNNWKQFILAITNQHYVSSLLKLANISYKNFKIDVGFYVFDEGGWVSSHIDNPGKLFTQVFYFNEYWNINWGGYLKILNGPDPDDVVFNIPPMGTFAATIFRKENAWHMVDPVSTQNQAKRQTLQLEVWECNS